jgi:flagellar protein FliO/FliZ
MQRRTLKPDGIETITQSAVRVCRPAAQAGFTTLIAAVCLAVLAPTAAAKAPAFHRDETPLPSSLTKPAAATAAAHSASTSGALARTVAGLAIVLAVLFGVYWLFKTYAKGKQTKSDGRLEIVATTALAPNRAVHLIRVGDALVLVGSAEGSITRLKAFSNEESAALEARLNGDPDQLRPFGSEQAGPSGFVDQLRRRTAR